MDWQTALIEAIGRLLVQVGQHETACPAAEDCAVELTDDINDLAYQLEHN